MKKLVWFVAGFTLSLSVAILGWPTVAVDTTDLDAATDSRSAARVDLLDAVQKLNIMIADRGVANGVAALTSTGGITVPKACVSGYIRVAVNYCHTISPVTTTLARDACTAIPVPAGSGAVALDLKYYSLARALNAVDFRYTQIIAYAAVSCGASTNDPRSYAYAREFTATALNSGLATDYSVSITQVLSGNAYVKMIDDAGNNGEASVSVLGYFD